MEFRKLMSKTRIVISAAVVLLAIYGFAARSGAKADAPDGSQVGTNIGNKAPELAFMNADSTKILKLSELKGKYVLIDFWASWCGPCRLANRQFVPIYQEFAPLGFTILGISLDRDTMAWHKAAMQDGVTWFDLCDGKGFGTRPAKDYGVKAVPFNVLVDPDGRILARDLKGPALRRWLSRELTSGLDQ